MFQRLLVFGVFAIMFVALFNASSVAQAQVEALHDQEARGLFEAGQAAFSDARYADALRYFEEAYELSRRPQLLFNIGISADRLRQDRVALDAFERFLAETPDDTPHRHDVTARIDVLRREVAAREARDAEVARAQEEAARAQEDGGPVPREDSALPEGEAAPASDAVLVPAAPDAEFEAAALATAPERTASGGSVGWALTGGSAALLGAGAVLFVVGQRKAANVEQATEGTAWSAVSSDARHADPLRNAGLVLLGVGVAGAGVGIAWAIAGRGSPDGASARVELLPGGLRLRGSF